MTSFYKHHTVHQSEFITNISSPNFLSSILSVFPSSERNDANIQNTAITSEFKTGGIFFIIKKVWKINQQVQEV